MRDLKKLITENFSDRSWFDHVGLGDNGLIVYTYDLEEAKSAIGQLESNVIVSFELVVKKTQSEETEVPHTAELHRIGRDVPYAEGFDYDRLCSDISISLGRAKLRLDKAQADKYDAIELLNSIDKRIEKAIEDVTILTDMYSTVRSNRHLFFRKRSDSDR